MKTNLQKIANDMVSKIENYIKNNKSTNSYDYEKGISKILHESCHQLFQASIGEIPQGINSKVNIKCKISPKVYHPKSFKVYH